MDYSSLVHILQRTQYTPTGFSCFRLGILPLLNDASKELSARKQFEYQITQVLFFKDVLKLDDVGRLAQLFEIVDFVLQGITSTPFHFGTIDGFDSIVCLITRF
jgi:hypothetical protein